MEGGRETTENVSTLSILMFLGEQVTAEYKWNKWLTFEEEGKNEEQKKKYNKGTLNNSTHTYNDICNVKIVHHCYLMF